MPEVASSRLASTQVVPVMDALLILGFLIDLVTPFFVWKGYLPDSVSWLSQAVAAAVVAFAYVRMMVMGRIPRGVLVILGIGAIGVTVAIFRGQGAAATLWGAWQFFKFPLVGLYAYLRPGWSKEFPDGLIKVTTLILVAEVVFQVGQYITGDVPGDSLAGSFGYKGASQIFFLSVFVFSMAMGQWLVNRQWKLLFLVLAAGIVGSVLAENKLFPVIVLLVAVAAFFLYLLRGGHPSRLLLFWGLFAAGVWVFSTGYNAFVPGAERRPLEQMLLDEETRSQYLNRGATWRPDSDRFGQGRNALVGYAFSTIASDPVTLVWGYGLGSRGESESLGVAGAAYQAGSFKRGSNLVVLIQELGLFGLLAAAGFVVWVTLVLFRDIRRRPLSRAAALRYGLLFFSLLWPLMLWYKRPMDARVTMWLYWVALGYAMSEAHEPDQDAVAGIDALTSYQDTVPAVDAG